MNCPNCGSLTCVLDSRRINDATRRRRECIKCKHKFTTYEVNENRYSVIKKMIEVVKECFTMD